MGVAKPDFLRCVGADQILIENAERFARILSDFEKELTHYKSSPGTSWRALSDYRANGWMD